MTRKPEEKAVIKAAAFFKHDGRDVQPGDVLIVTKAEADDLCAINMATLEATATRASPPYRDRAMHSRRDRQR